MTIDTYIKKFPQDVQNILEKIRQTIRSAAPNAEEAISYGMPAFKLNGKALVYFGGFKKHVSLFALPSGTAAFKKDLVAYKTSKGTIQFPLSRDGQLDEPIPYTLIEKIVKFRVREMQQKL